ncbi:ABC transporter permease [Dactylosporangium sp. NPDC000244]|uniref:ABC transporter permease n=1 Tax=Dactylosporangium sp. NPDC000244 TaxID=3154365 RepID=UPI003323D686
MIAPKKRKPALLALNIASAIAGLGVWWIWSVTGENVPTPVEVARRMGELFADGTLEADILASLQRVLIGFALGCAVAIPVGFLMGWYAVARAVFEPWVQFFRTVPPLALIPLVVVLLGIGEEPKIFVIYVAAFLSCVIATFQGVVDVDRTLLNAARVLGAPTRTIFARVVVPASMPYILVGMRVGLGSAWGTLVAAELVAAQEGLGYRMQNAQIYVDRPTIFAALICIGILGLLMDRVLLLVERRATSWQERR